MLRVVSQDEMVDIPYDQTSFSIVNGKEFIIKAEWCGTEKIMAVYKSHNMAKFELNMLRLRYSNLMEAKSDNRAIDSNKFLYQFPPATE